MKFMIQFKLTAGTRNKAVEAFEQRGPSRLPGVQLAAAWVGTQEDVAFVLVDAQDEAHVAKAVEAWASFGAAEIHSVIDIQQY